MAKHGKMMKGGKGGGKGVHPNKITGPDGTHDKSRGASGKTGGAMRKGSKGY